MENTNDPNDSTFTQPKNLVRFPDGSLIEFSQHDPDGDPESVHSLAGMIWTKIQALDAALRAAHAVMHAKGRG